MAELFLIVRIADHRVAIAADRIDSVVEVDQITPVPRVSPHVAGLFALRSRVLTVIDSHVALGAPPMPREGALSGVIVTTDGHSYALLVDQVDDVVTDATVVPSVAVLGAGWSRIVIGQLTGASLGEASVLLIDPDTLITIPESRAA